MTEDERTPLNDRPGHASDSVAHDRDERFMLLEAQQIAHVGSYIWDFATGALRWSDECYRLFGVDRDTFTPTVDTAIDAIHPADRANAQAWASAQLAGTEPSPLTYRSVWQDGSVHWLFTDGKLYRGADGTPIRMIGTIQDVTQRRQAEEDLRHSQERLQAILDQSASLVYAVDLDGRFTLANARLATVVGRSVEEIVGAVREDFLPPDVAASHRANDLEVIRTREPITLEETSTLADGVHTFLSVKFPLFDAAGELAAVCGISADITERKRAELALRESEERFTSAFHTSPAAISITRIADGLFVDVNQAFLNLFEFNREDVIGHTSLELGMLTPDERAQLIRTQLATGGLHDAELTTRSKSGRVLHLLLSSKPLLIVGEPHHVTTLIDITERKRIELERQKFFLLAESSNEFIAMCDLEMQPLYVNPAGVRMVGLSSMDEACRVQVQDYFFPEDQAFITDEFFPRVLREGHGEVEIRLRHFVTGEPIWFDYYLFSIKDYTGTAIGWATVSHNISERKRAEHERELLQAQLVQAQKMESVGRLAGGVAHDFNNMLSAILGYSEMALQKMLPSDPLREDLEEIRGAARRSADLTRQLLAFSRKQIVAPQVLDINETIQAMLRLLGRLIGEDVELTWKPGSNIWPVEVDPAQVDQILANLCVNARDAISGVGNITIETSNVAFDEQFCAQFSGYVAGEFVCIAVSDNGSGMDAETRSHLFEPFFTTKGLGKGTGLGLASVYGAVKQNAGFISVESAPGEGTAFKIYLPRLAAASAANAPTIAPREERGTSATILVVEDEPVILDVARRMLERLGYRVIVARTPRDAISQAATFGGRIDLVITDVVMPEMNGRDLADELQLHRPDLRRLFMSGYTTDVVVHRGVLEPGVHFIPKPFSQKELDAKVREALKR